MGTRVEQAAMLRDRIKRNLGVFEPPVYNHTVYKQGQVDVHDPHDKYGSTRGDPDAMWHNRLRLTGNTGGRGSIIYSQPASLWKERIVHEEKLRAKADGRPTPPGAAAPYAAAAPPPATPPPGAVLPPGWYYVPAMGADGQLQPTLTYVPYAFAAPPGVGAPL